MIHGDGQTALADDGRNKHATSGAVSIGLSENKTAPVPHRRNEGGVDA